MLAAIDSIHSIHSVCVCSVSVKRSVGGDAVGDDGEVVGDVFVAVDCCSLRCVCACVCEYQKDLFLLNPIKIPLSCTWQRPV